MALPLPKASYVDAGGPNVSAESPQHVRTCASLKSRTPQQCSNHGREDVKARCFDVKVWKIADIAVFITFQVNLHNTNGNIMACMAVRRCTLGLDAELRRSLWEILGCRSLHTFFIFDSITFLKIKMLRCICFHVPEMSRIPI